MQEIEINTTIFVNNKEYYVEKLLGHGKGGYSFLVKEKDDYYVLKKIHHEQCDYYQFGNKIESEINDYHKLKDIVLMPELIDVDYDNEIIIKEYIDGKTIKELIDNKVDIGNYRKQIKEISEKCRLYNLNIDYYPTNFIVSENRLYYIDYECNNYLIEYSYEKWGYQYWKDIN